MIYQLYIDDSVTSVMLKDSRVADGSLLLETTWCLEISGCISRYYVAKAGQGLFCRLYFGKGYKTYRTCKLRVVK
jgi:hypothetical protein